MQNLGFTFEDWNLKGLQGQERAILHRGLRGKQAISGTVGLGLGAGWHWMGRVLAVILGRGLDMPGRGLDMPGRGFLPIWITLGRQGSVILRVSTGENISGSCR